jgi:hypothetical protein
VCSSDLYSLGQGALKASFSGGAGGAEGGPVRLNDELAWADRAGTVHVHFPRVGFRITPA